MAVGLVKLPTAGLQSKFMIAWWGLRICIFTNSQVDYNAVGPGTKALKTIAQYQADPSLSKNVKVQFILN